MSPHWNAGSLSDRTVSSHLQHLLLALPQVLLSQSPATSGSAATKGGIWTDFDMQALSGQHHWSAASDVLIEIWYLEGYLISRDKDPLVWWQENKQTFPALSRLAVRYLWIVASSVSAERIFSKAREVVSKECSRLKGKNVNKLLFVNKNLWMGKSVNVNCFVEMFRQEFTC